VRETGAASKATGRSVDRSGDREEASGLLRGGIKTDGWLAPAGMSVRPLACPRALALRLSLQVSSGILSALTTGGPSLQMGPPTRS
jgi:hypothetical protein